MRYGLRAILLLAASGMAVAAGPSSPVSQLAGRYSHRFANGLVTGERYTSEDVVEIVPVDANHAYVRMELQFFNGHSCSLAGITRAEGKALVYHEPASASPIQDAQCVLTLKRDGAKLRWSDGEGSCRSHCGARGGMSDGDLPWTSRRPITYLKRLRGSTEYRDAIDAWHGDGGK